MVSAWAHPPNPAAVARELGVSRTAARNMMLRLVAAGAMKRPKLVLKGEWAVTPKGLRLLRSVKKRVDESK